jgi:nitrite reductase/ring-hydroxylating ferredoxin subunit
MRVAVCEAGALVQGTPHIVSLGRDDRGRPREAIVLRDRDGVPRAYLNLCRHLPIPLDGFSRQVLAPDGVHLRCGTHGALYRPEDGACVEGPCTGKSLEALPLEEEAGILYVTG